MASVDASAPAADGVRRILGNLGQVVTGVAQVRNGYGTGHGRVNARDLEIAQARLVVNGAVAIATFLAGAARRVDPQADRGMVIERSQHPRLHVIAQGAD